jgi:uncharacterized membrane protein
LSDRPPSPVNPPQQSPIASVNELFYEERSFGQRAADAVTEFVGSWQFIIVQSITLVLWVALNTAALIAHWDPYPFIFMNLLVSLESALASPMILMSQNRQADRDRAIARNEFVLTLKAEAEVRAILAHLAAQDKAIAELRDLLIALQTGAPSGASAGTSSAPPAEAGGGRG